MYEKCTTAFFLASAFISDGANAVEYALIMALVAVFIIAGVLAMSGAIGNLFNNMATCLANAPGCSTATFSG